MKVVNERFVREHAVVSQWRFSFVFNLFAEQKIADDRMLEDRHREHGTDARAEPIDDDVLNVSVTRASPFEAGTQDGIEISAREIEGFKIEK